MDASVINIGELNHKVNIQNCMALHSGKVAINIYDVSITKQ